ncbi:alpha/beta hydrolase [Alishewanella sp. SMS8]|uniref:alpha/beta hydrolase n=1 Tax=Alishewanella sp. SMS8 TaxID=2994676 RepID=UPI002741153A|nr:alpha/beta hydrolase [Alishewanella sp. SMS8]MDP5206522.1 alpha/beta hydrolase [Alishewanella sp. SMS9]MDP5458939.1 alpha/beta hydrolase [Alishewanella sp. SMS8]
MFIITNRRVNVGKTTVKTAFGDKPAEGPNELRLAEASRVNSKWHINVFPDRVNAAGQAVTAKKAQEQDSMFASEYVAKQLVSKLKNYTPSRHLMLYVHGFNNDLASVLDRAEQLEQNYNLEVVIFSWPANGGGVQGVLSYKSDKRDALASVGALNRVLERLQSIVQQLHADYVEQLEQTTEAKFGDDAEKWDRYFTAAAAARCPFTINLMLHSMGNYLYKHLLSSSVYAGDQLIFDNIVMVAADANNAGHANWVDNIQCRNRLYITLNEHDSALRASRMKMGEKQRARLGHYLRCLESKTATYINFTGQAHVGTSHAYFEGKPLENSQVRSFFQLAFNGQTAEDSLTFDAARNLYYF